jgi:hypothetical protein
MMTAGLSLYEESAARKVRGASIQMHTPIAYSESQRTTAARAAPILSTVYSIAID